MTENHTSGDVRLPDYFKKKRAEGFAKEEIGVCKALNELEAVERIKACMLLDGGKDDGAITSLEPYKAPDQDSNTENANGHRHWNL